VASFWLSHQQPIHVPLLPCLCYMPYPPYRPQFYNANYYWQRIEIMKLIIQFSSLSCHIVPLQSKYSNARDLVSHPHRTTGKIIILSILIFYVFWQQMRKQAAPHGVTSQKTPFFQACSYPYSRLKVEDIACEYNTSDPLMISKAAYVWGHWGL
jgi:hypothetical protein